MTKLGSTWYHITVDFFQWNLYVEGVFFSAPIYIRFSKKWCYLCVKGDYVIICGKNVGLLLHDKWKKKKQKTKIVEFLFFLRKKWDIYLPVGMRREFLGYGVNTTHIIHLTVRDGYIIRISWLVSCSLNQVFMVLSSDELNCKSETQYIGMYNLCTEVKSRSNCAIFKLTGILLYIFLCKRYVHINKYNICTCKHTYYVYIIDMYTLTNSILTCLGYQKIICPLIYMYI